MTLGDIKEKITRIVQDTAKKLSDVDLDGFTIEALANYSKDRPYVKVNDTTGTGTYDYTLPSDWVTDFSVIREVEYPAGEQVPTILEPEEYGLYQNASTTKLRLYNYSPTTSETIRITYTLPYTKATIGNIPAQDIDAFCNLAASLCCSALARIHAQTSEINYTVDNINYRSKGDEYARRAKELMGLYQSLIGIGGEVQAASKSVNWDTSFSWGGDFLTHPKAYR